MVPGDEVCLGVAQFGRAPVLGTGGRRFKSSFPDHIASRKLLVFRREPGAVGFHKVYDAGRHGSRVRLITFALAGSTPAPAIQLIGDSVAIYVMHVYGERGRCGKEYEVEAASEVKARAKAKAMYWDDFKEAAVACEWIKFRMKLAR